MRMNGNDFKLVYEGTIEGGGVRGRPSKKLINRIKEVLRERWLAGDGVC